MSDYDEATQTTVSVPTLIICGVILFFTVRYFYNLSSSSTSSASSSSGQRRRQVPREAIETVMTMFPQLQARDVEYALLNGGSIQGTTETILRTGSLHAAPPSFTSQSLPDTSSPSLSTSTAARSAPQQSQPKYADLITRYNLSSKVAKGKDKEISESKGQETGTIQTAEAQRQKGGWSWNKNERQEVLKRRREEMVLQARRKMEEKGDGR